MKHKTTYRIILSIILIKIYSVCQGQNLNYINDRCYGTPGAEKGCRIIQAGSNLLISGNTFYSGTIDDKSDSSCYNSISGMNWEIWNVLIDTALNKLSDQTLGGSNDDQSPIPYNSLLNQKIYISARSNSDSSCEKSYNSKGNFDYWLIKLDYNLNVLQNIVLGSQGPESTFMYKDLPSGNSILFGSSGNIIGGDKTDSGNGSNDFWLIKLDSIGNKIWDKCYGGSSSEMFFNLVGWNDTRADVLSLSGDSILIVGQTNSPVSGMVSDPGFGNYDVWLILIDSAGNRVWDKRFGGSLYESINSIISTSDGYLCAGTTNSDAGGSVSDSSLGTYDVWLIKLDKAGNKIWDKRYGGNANDFATYILPSPDHGFWILGTTSSSVGGDLSEPSYGGGDFWIVKIDSAGMLLWEKRFGGPGNDLSTNFVIMPDSSIYLCGFAQGGTSAVKSDSGRGDYDYWVLHFNYYNTTTGLAPSSIANTLRVWPNPFHEAINIEGLLPANLYLTLYSPDGKQLWSQRTEGKRSLLIHLPSGLHQGIYFLRVEGPGFTSTVRICKI
ncbi:MAG: T9SS type A sorting domain-containing protein [Bacteroidia bacterium]|nr:T9SS type A sorting domain-containing protein [Bacteroidia bacterium]